MLCGKEEWVWMYDDGLGLRMVGIADGFDGNMPWFVMDEVYSMQCLVKLWLDGVQDC